MRTVDKTLSVGHRALPGTDNTLGKKKNPVNLKSVLNNFPTYFTSLLFFFLILLTKKQGDKIFS